MTSGIIEIVYTLFQETYPLPKAVRFSLVSLVLLLLLLPCYPGQAQQETPTRYFPATGHYLKEPFLSFFDANGGLRTWGPPITEVVDENGHLVQYFQRARMACLQQTEDPCNVQLSPLPELLGHRTPRTAPVSKQLIANGLCQYFAETGHNLCFSFLTFYMNQGGSSVFGPPIGELTVEPGMIVQYLERARIEWHMDAPPGESIELGAIGQEYFEAKGLDPVLLLPVESPPTAQIPPRGISVGDRVRVVGTEGAGLRFRTEAGLDHETTRMLAEGDILVVVGGPTGADGFTWWHLDYHGSLGWCAAQWLEPIEPANSS